MAWGVWTMETLLQRSVQAAQTPAKPDSDTSIAWQSKVQFCQLQFCPCLGKHTTAAHQHTCTSPSSCKRTGPRTGSRKLISGGLLKAMQSVPPLVADHETR